MTSGHILTIVQNMIVGQNPFWNKPPGIALRNIRHLLAYIIVTVLLQLAAVALKFAFVSPARKYDLRPFTSNEGIRSWDW